MLGTHAGGRARGPPLHMYDPDIHHRHSLRWHKHNYSSPGAYYVTICVQENRCLLGSCELGAMKLNDAGRMVNTEWLQLPTRFPTVRLDEHIVMPNHFHGILQLVGEPFVGALASPVRREARAQGPPPRPTLGDVIGAFKSLTTDGYIKGVRNMGWPRFCQRFWQRDYYDHVIRDQAELEKIRDYIRRNPLRWSCDRYNAENAVLVIDQAGILVPWHET